MKEIPLSQGKVALVDDEDYDELSTYKWSAFKSRNTFYASRHIPHPLNPKKQKTIYMHHQAVGAAPGRVVDHADHNGLNNQKYNLRLATHQQNLWNTASRSGSSSRFLGVSFNRQKSRWVSTIQVQGKKVHIGYFSCEEDAARAYDCVAINTRGVFANTNFPFTSREDAKATNAI